MKRTRLRQRIALLYLAVLSVMTGQWLIRGLIPATGHGDLSFVRNYMVACSLRPGISTREALRPFEGCWFTIPNRSELLQPHAPIYTEAHYGYEVEWARQVDVSYDRKNPNHNAAAFIFFFKDGKFDHFDYIGD